MKTVMKLLAAVLAVVAIVIIAIAVTKYMAIPASNLEPITSAEDLKALVDKVYEGLDVEMPMVETKVLELTDNDAVKYSTGLENADDVEFIVESMPMMMAQPYSFVLAKVKDGVNVEEVAKKMNENIDERKWVCVLPEKVYTTTSGDVICLVMAREEVGKPVYEKFKTLAGTIGEEYVRTVEDGQLPEDMLPGADDGLAFPGEEDSTTNSVLQITSSEDLTALVDKIYEGLEIEMPMLMSQTIDVTDNDAVKYATGLEKADDVEYVVASEPMMSSQAYSLVLVKVKDGVDANKVAKEMNENIDARKWICVTAEKVYSTSSEDVVCLVMSNKETAKAVYDNFKTLAETVNEEYERTVEDGQLPEDM